jgi:hypothetical protein
MIFDIHIDNDRRDTPDLAITLTDYGKGAGQFKRHLWKYR